MTAHNDKVEARVTVIGYRTTYTEVSKPYQFEVSLEHRDDAGCIIGISAGDTGIEWPEPLLGWLISSLSQIKAARSASEDTQQAEGAATPSHQLQELIEAAEKICAEYPLDSATTELQLALQNVKKSDK